MHWKYPMPLVIKVMQIKTILKFNLAQDRMVIIKTWLQMIEQLWKQENFFTAGVNVNWFRHFGKQCRVWWLSLFFVVIRSVRYDFPLGNTTHLVTEHKEVKLNMSWELSPCLLAFPVPKGVKKVAREAKSSTVLLNCKFC